MCWSAPVTELKSGQKLRQARGTGTGGGPAPQAFALVSVAEDARFELARAAPNTLSKSAGRHPRQPSPHWTWRDDALATGGGQCRTGLNETETESKPGRRQAGGYLSPCAGRAPGKAGPASEPRGD